jgi:DHA1 family multidrug resistance protein B-like MFS transporter
MPPQDLLSLHGLVLHTTGTQMLGILRAENTALVVLMALFAARLFGRMPDRVRLYLGIAVFIGGYMMLAVSNTGWVLMFATLIFTVGELMNVPVKQALLADLIPEGDRSRYMAIYNISIGSAQMIATLFIALGAAVPPAGIAACYGIIGVIIVLNYRSVLNTQAPRHPVPSAAKARSRQA